MSVLVIEAAAPLVDLDTAKAHCKVDGRSEDGLIDAYIRAACGHVDGPDGWVGRAFGVQTLELRLDAFPPTGFRLPVGPVIEVVSILYDDADGVEQTLSPATYRLERDAIWLASGQSFPATFDQAGAVRVRYRAGQETPPSPVTAAVLLMVGDLYANRETVGEKGGAIPMSVTVERLLSPYRTWR